MTGSGLRRRTVTGAALAGAGVPLLAACGGDDESPDSTASEPSSPSSTAPSSEAPSAEPSRSPSDKPEPALVDVTDVPVGGGTIIAKEEVVVTQPERGRIMCFSAVCTHRGCVVSGVADGTIQCGCHGSSFSVADGTVVNGPATTALPTVKIAVQDGVVRRA